MTPPRRKWTQALGQLPQRSVEPPRRPGNATQGAELQGFERKERSGPEQHHPVDGFDRRQAAQTRQLHRFIDELTAPAGVLAKGPLGLVDPGHEDLGRFVPESERRRQRQPPGGAALGGGQDSAPCRAPAVLGGPRLVHIDLLSPATFASGHPVEQYRWLQEHAPVYWHDEPDGPGFWALTCYEDVAEVGRQPMVFSSEPTVMVADPDASALGLPDDHKMMLMMDPPQHTQFRRIISREFTRGPAAELKPRVAELSAQIIERESVKDLRKG